MLFRSDTLRRIGDISAATGSSISDIADIYGKAKVQGLFLWVVANWCLTTLFDGEGSFKDIFIACGYSLVPLILTVVPCTIYTNFALLEELDITDLVVTVGFIWTMLLIFVGMMVTHDYTLSKNFITSLGTVVAMVFIMFVAILFTTLVGKIISFITNIVTEISYRM